MVAKLFYLVVNELAALVCSNGNQLDLAPGKFDYLKCTRHPNQSHNLIGYTLRRTDDCMNRDFLAFISEKLILAFMELHISDARNQMWFQSKAVHQQTDHDVG